MLHPRLTGILRMIDPSMPAEITPADAWQRIRPSSRPFLRGSFWQVVSRLPFKQSAAGQVELAEWIWREKERAQKAGRAFPPAPIEVKPAFTPQPRI